MIKINGEKLNEDKIKLTDYLNEKDYSKTKIAVELNGEILPKSEYENTTFVDGDSVEIVSFVGGG